MKKKILSALLAALMVFGFAACGSSPEPAATPDPEPNTQEPAGSASTEPPAAGGDAVKLTMGIWDVNQEPGMKEMVAKFTEQNPNITVEVQVTPWDEYWTKMEAAATGGAMPDVFWMHTNEFSKYAGNDMLMPLDDVVGDVMGNFPESLVSLATYSDGTLYGVPKDFDTIAMGYNKELFDAAGVDYPSDGWTWDDFLTAAKAISALDDQTWGFLAPLEDQVGYLPWIYQAGGNVLDGKEVGIDSPEAQKGLQFYVDLINKEKVSPTLAELTDTHFMGFFQSGRAGMVLIGSWQMSAYADNDDIKDIFDLAVLPKDVRNATMINGLSFGGSAKTEHPEEVKSLLQFLAGEEAQTLQAESGTAISAFDGTSEKWLAKYPQYNVNTFLEMTDYAFAVPTSNTKSKWGETMTEMVKKMLMNEISVEDGTAVIADEMRELLATE